jgi:hypothetical protein
MIQCQFKPIEKWPSKPTPSWGRQASRFKAGWTETLDLLERGHHRGILYARSDSQRRLAEVERQAESARRHSEFWDEEGPDGYALR